MGRFPVGVASYLFREHVPFAKKLTAGHHLWFLPTYLWVLRREGVPARAWIVTAVLTSYLIAFSRAFIPFEIVRNGTSEPIYLNVNLAYEFWSDVDISLLHAFDGSHPSVYLPYAVVVCNVLLNGPPFLLLWLGMRVISHRRKLE